MGRNPGGVLQIMRKEESSRLHNLCRQVVGDQTVEIHWGDALLSFWQEGLNGNLKLFGRAFSRSLNDCDNTLSPTPWPDIWLSYLKAASIKFSICRRAKALWSPHIEFVILEIFIRAEFMRASYVPTEVTISDALSESDWALNWTCSRAGAMGQAHTSAEVWVCLDHNQGESASYSNLAHRNFRVVCDWGGARPGKKSIVGSESTGVTKWAETPN